jgi:hypothetical protein
MTDKTLNPRDDAEAGKLRLFMCDNFFGVRTFGAVMSTGINCGQVRGPVQFSFARSVEPVVPLEIAITRMAATNEAEKAKQAEGGDDERTENRTMGRKYIVPYGLYRAHSLSLPSWPNGPAFQTETFPSCGTLSRTCSSTIDQRRAMKWRRASSSSSNTQALSAMRKRMTCSTAFGWSE